MVVPSKPRRRSYQTGESLPALTDEYRPIPLGRDENGEPDGQIRALGVLIRNRSSETVYIKEGPDEIDEMAIARGEDYRIWEPNGVSSLNLKGTSGGETVEIRTLEAHNDFDLTDRIEAFARSLAHFVGTATRDTRITGQDVDISIDDAGGLDVTGSVEADITGQDIPIEVDGTVNALVDGSVDAHITGQDQDLQFDAGSIVVDDILTTSTTFDGDITGQANFDLGSFNRQGFTNTRFLRETGISHDASNDWTLFSNAAFAGSVESYQVRVYCDPGVNNGAGYDDIGALLLIVRPDGLNVASPPRAHSTLRAASHPSTDVEVGRNSSARECVYTFSPDAGIYFEEGDDVIFVIQNMGDINRQPGPGFTGEYNVEMSVTVNRRQRQ